MQSWFLSESPGEYQWGEVPTPEPGVGEIRVRLIASGVNHIDHWQTRGLPKPKSFPHVPGSDGAGVVDAICDGVTRFSVGDEVAINAAQTNAAAIEKFGIDSVFDPSLQLMGEHRWGATVNRSSSPTTAPSCARPVARGRSARRTPSR